MTSVKEWIEEKIKNEYIRYFEYDKFSQIVEIDRGRFGKVSRANLTNAGLVALKITFSKNSEEKLDEFVNELKLLREVDYHPNINRFLGVTKDSKYYTLVLEYANEGNLRDYLKISFTYLKWNDKIKMALDITSGLKFLHSKEIIHRNLHSKNILVNNGKLLIANLGLSKKLAEITSNSMGNRYGMVEYIEPQCLRNIKYKKDKSSDIYSLGVLLWEITSGRPPFSGYQQNILDYHIKNGHREEPIEGTLPEYRKLYQKCWDGEPKSRPNIEDVHEILCRLNAELQPSIHNINDKKVDNDDLYIFSDHLNLNSLSKFNELYYIKDGHREEPIVGTPSEYQKLYQKYWDGEPKLRPDIEAACEFFNAADKLKLEKNCYSNWLENEECITHYKYSEFTTIRDIGKGSFGSVFCALWKNTDQVFILKSFNGDNKTLKEIVNELKLQKRVDFHENIIRLHGIATMKKTSTIQKYALVLEFADSGSLKTYLSRHSNDLKWDDKYRFTSQLASAIACIHECDIIHGDLHAENVFVHQKKIKLADFGLSRRIAEASSNNRKIFGVIPYIDPKKLEDQHNYKLNKKSDVYSFGVLMWHISSGYQPYRNDNYDVGLAISIINGRREENTVGTPLKYSELFTECWKHEPDERPSIRDVVSALEAFFSEQNCDVVNVEGNNSLKKYKSIPKSSEGIIQQLKLTHGLFLNGHNIQSSKQAIATVKGKLNVSLYNEQPIIYTNVNDPTSPKNLLNFISDGNNFINVLQPSDMCINFPIAEITYDNKGNLSESFLKCVDNGEKLYELYGHFFARKTLIGGKLFIRGLNLVPSTQIDIFMLYITWAYKSAKYNIENPINDLPISYLPRINTLDGLLLDTPEKISNWLNNLYQNNMLDIISYKDLIPVAQLKNNLSSEEIFEEKQPGVANFKEKLSLKEWVGSVIYINLVRWIKDFHFSQGIIITKFCKMEISKKIAASFIKVPIVKPSNKTYLEIIRPTNKVEEFLINNNIFSVKDVSSFPFINMIQPDDSSYGDYNFLVKFEQYEIHINGYIKPSDEFKQAINNALNSMKPFKALHDVFDEYGHVFPQKIILGRSFKRNIRKTYDIPNRINLKSKSLETYLDKLNISYLLTRKGNIIEKHKLFDTIQNLNDDDLEVVEFDDIISLYKILDEQLQKKINSIISDYEQDNYKIIMTGITDLKDLDNNNTDHYKRINIQPSLEDENYEVIGSVISKQKDSKSEEFLLKFRLYDFNGFSAMIKTLKNAEIKIEECCILWMIIGIPSKLSVLSPRNQDLQIKYKESVTLQSNQLEIKTPILLSLGDIISVNARSQITYESINIKLVEWSESCIRFQTNESKSNSLTNIEPAVNSIKCNISILCSNYNTFRIDNGNEEYPLDLIGYKLSKENFNENLSILDE